ncbi:MAG: outer membrane lipoprotein carrier protein LolA [Myxococcota bacterium]
MRNVSIVVIVSSLASALVAAQTPSLSAREVAALVQSFYDQTQSFQAEFNQTQYTKVYDRTERANGRVTFKKPGKMRWDYAEPNGQVFVSNGERLYIYQPPDEGEQHGQMIERAIDDDQLPLAFSFLTGTGRLDRDFRMRLLDPERQGFQQGYVLELRPRRATTHYDRVLFFVRVVGEGESRAGYIQRVLIIDSSGNRNRFDFRRPNFNANVGDDRFQYTPPRGTRRIRP